MEVDAVFAVVIGVYSSRAPFFEQDAIGCILNGNPERMLFIIIYIHTHTHAYNIIHWWWTESCLCGRMLWLYYETRSKGAVVDGRSKPAFVCVCVCVVLWSLVRFVHMLLFPSVILIITMPLAIHFVWPPQFRISVWVWIDDRNRDDYCELIRCTVRTGQCTFAISCYLYSIPKFGSIRYWQYHRFNNNQQEEIIRTND